MFRIGRPGTYHHRMKPGKNLKDRLGKQAGLPTSASGLSVDSGLGKLLEAERVRKRDAAETAGKPSAKVSSGSSGHLDTGTAKGAGKSTTNQGLR